MANYSLSRLERLYLQLQTTFGAIPNSGGTASVSNSNCCRHIKVKMDNDVGLLIRKDKTGSRTATQGIVGRKFGKWSTEMSLAPNGTPGVIPDADPILQSMFGQAAAVTSGTVSITSSTNASPIVLLTAAHGVTTGAFQALTVAGHDNVGANGTWLAQAVDATHLTLIGSVGTSIGTGVGTVSKAAVVYKVLDTPLLTFAAYSFRQPSTLNQRCAFGCAVSNAQFELGQDIATWTSDGECMWVLESDFFSSADTAQQGGLSAFPSEPSTPVTNGGIVAGFTGRAVVNGGTVANIRTASVKYQTGAAVIKDLFGSYYPDSVEADERNVGVSLNLYDNDATATQNLRNLGNTRTPVDIVLQVGQNPGSIMIVLLRGVQIAPAALEDGQRRFVASIPESRAFGSSITAKDEIAIWFA